LSEDNLNVMYV